MDEFIKYNACIVMLHLASQCLLGGSRMFAEDDVDFFDFAFWGFVFTRIKCKQTLCKT